MSSSHGNQHLYGQSNEIEMKNLRVLIVSNVRPSRCWNFANRIKHEVTSAQVCGIIQRPFKSIPMIQRQIAKGETNGAATWISKMRGFLNSILQRLLDALLWLVHGCPMGLGNHKTFTTNRLRMECARSAWAFALMKGDNVAKALDSMSLDRVDLVILLGDFPSIETMFIGLPGDCIHACSHAPEHDQAGPSSKGLIYIERFTKKLEQSYTVASVSLPWQPYEGLVGFTLKTDLIADDLLLQSVNSLVSEESPNLSRSVQQWADRTLGPCLAQFTKSAELTPQKRDVPKRCRSRWKLCLDAVVLCSPWVVLRNFYRRLKGQYPVLILAHHLVSDRPHRMGISTEDFFQQIRYLQKHYRIVGLLEATELLRSGKVQVPTVVLTFDDGYADNFLNLRAVANETGIPTTLFITTHPVESGKEFEHDTAKGMTGFFPMTWDQIQYWSSRGAEFGSHTRTHMDCGTQDQSKLQAEIVGSKEDLEAQLGKPVRLFAFPYGQRKNMSPEALHLAASVYSYFVSSFGGEASPGKNKLSSHLLRKNLYANQWELELELQSVFDFVVVIRRLLRRIRQPRLSTEATLPMAAALGPSISAGAEETLGEQQTLPRAS